MRILLERSKLSAPLDDVHLATLERLCTVLVQRFDQGHERVDAAAKLCAAIRDSGVFESGTILDADALLERIGILLDRLK